MKIGSDIRTAAVIALLCCTICVSCSREAIDIPVRPADPEPMQVGFRIALGDTSSAYDTRADLDDGTAVDYENYIDLENRDYRIYFFSTDDKYIDTFTPETLTPLSDNPLRAKLYEVAGKIEQSLPDAFKVVVLANWPAYPTPVAGSTTIDDICTSASSLYDYRTPFRPSNDPQKKRLIPMFGVKSCTDMIFVPDMLTYVGTIHLLRAMAKVEVCYTADTWTIESVTLDRYNSRGYCAPEGVYDQSDYIFYENGIVDYVKRLHLYGDRNDTDAKMPLAFDETAPGRYTIYIPEYRNTTAGGGKAADAAQIHVKFKEFPDKEYPIEFKYYNAPADGAALGDPFDIRRNRYYRFSVVKSAEPEFIVDVFPYEVKELDPGFGILP